MKLTNLREGDIVPSYKRLCELLEIKYSNKKLAREGQLVELSKYINYEEIGRAYRIISVRKVDKNIVLFTPSTKKRKRPVSPEELYIKNCLLASLVIEGESNITMSKQYFYQMVGLVSAKYLKARANELKVSKEIGVDSKTLSTFLDSTNRSMLLLMENALNSLKDNKIIYWSYELTICEPVNFNNVLEVESKQYKNEEGDDKTDYNFNLRSNHVKKSYRPSSEEEKLWILKCEREALMEFTGSQLSSVQEIVSKGKYNSYSNRVLELVRSRYPYVMFYFDSVNIVHTPDYTKDFVLSMMQETDEDNTENFKAEVKGELNSLFSNRIRRNAVSRSNRRRLYKLEETTWGDVDNTNDTECDEYLQDCLRIIKRLIEIH